MENIQYFHKRIFDRKNMEISARGGVTFALDVSSLSEKLVEVRAGENIILRAGAAICSELDNYDKKIGRNIAKGRIKSKSFQVIDITDKYVTLETGGLIFTVLIFGQKLHFVSVV